MNEIQFKKLHPDVVVPAYAHEGDAGMDVRSLEDYEMKSGDRHVFDLGFAASFPAGYVARMADKSSMGKRGIHVLGGVIDAGYRGEYKLLLAHLGDEPHQIHKGDKLAQLIFYPIATPEVIVVDQLDDTTRGAGGFGSTGR